MNILFAAAEVRPWSKTGGLSDVMAALPAALAQSGRHSVAVVSPLYREARRTAAELDVELVDTGVGFDWTLQSTRYTGRFVRAAMGDGAAAYFLDCPALYDREGLYLTPDGREWPDNGVRFGFFSKAVAERASALMGGVPDVIHANDWQTGLVMYWARATRADNGPALVFGLHNLGYQGVYDAELHATLGLPATTFNLHELEYFGRINLLKAGIVYSDVVATVSPTYAEEITTPAFGHSLDGLMRAHSNKLHGVLNGIDTDTWNPATDPAIAAAYDATSLARKADCHADLCAELGLDPLRRPLFGLISRFAWQKGIDVVADIAEPLVEAGAALAVLGSGDDHLELRFADLAERFPGAISVRLGFDVALSHRIEAGADAFLMPSRYEPCGLNQMYSMAYGTVPVVAAVGGLRDTVIDASPAAIARGDATGFVCAGAERAALWHATDRAIRCFRDTPESWARLARNGMSHDFGWRRPALRYEELYRLAVGAASQR